MYVNCESNGGSGWWEHVGLDAADLEPCGLGTVVLLFGVSGLRKPAGLWLVRLPDGDIDDFTPTKYFIVCIYIKNTGNNHNLLLH